MIDSKAPIYYHEDFYRQIEFVPEENYFTANRSIVDLPPNEGSIFGFDSCVSRPEQKTILSERQITLDNIGEILNPLSFFYSTNVKTGYGQTAYRDEGTSVWAFEDYGIFIKVEGTIIQAIWLCDGPQFLSGDGNRLASAILSVCLKYLLIFIDWNKEIVCRFTSLDSVMKYLQQNLLFS